MRFIPNWRCTKGRYFFENSLKSQLSVTHNWWTLRKFSWLIFEKKMLWNVWQVNLVFMWDFWTGHGILGNRFWKWPPPTILAGSLSPHLARRDWHFFVLGYSSPRRRITGYKSCRHTASTQDTEVFRIGRLRSLYTILHISLWGLAMSPWLGSCDRHLGCLFRGQLVHKTPCTLGKVTDLCKSSISTNFRSSYCMRAWWREVWLWNVSWGCWIEGIQISWIFLRSCTRCCIQLWMCRLCDWRKLLRSWVSESWNIVAGV